MAYDAATQQMIYFGGEADATWLWNGTSWNQVDDANDPGCISHCTNSPPNMNTLGMTYDAASQQVVVFGGDYGNDTWAWNGAIWTQVADGTDPGCYASCTNSPPDTIGTQMAYDPATQQVVLFGASVNYGGVAPNANFTWVLSYNGGTYSWAQVDDATDPGCITSCVNSPPGRNVAQMAFDYATNQLVVFGGEEDPGSADGQSDTWVWNGTTWTQVDDNNGVDAGCGATEPTLLQCPSSPPGRVGFGMAYDPALAGLVLFGGMTDYGHPQYNDTWLWNGNVWTQVDDATDPGCVATCTEGPQPLDTFAMADDPATNQIVLYGAEGTWTALATPLVAPAPSGLQISPSAYVVNGGYHASLAAQWYPSTGVTSYTCTLMYGYNIPSTFSVNVTSPACSFEGLSLSESYGISIVAHNGAIPSSATIGFAQTPSLSTITCRRGKHKVQVTAINPTCPAGYAILG